MGDRDGCNQSGMGGNARPQGAGACQGRGLDTGGEAGIVEPHRRKTSGKVRKGMGKGIWFPYRRHRTISQRSATWVRVRGKESV